MATDAKSGRIRDTEQVCVFVYSPLQVYSVITNIYFIYSLIVLFVFVFI